MQIRSIQRYARISPFKAREVTREIQGLPATDALDILKFTPKKAARLVTKTLQSAIANAENNNNLRAETLVIKEAVVGEGPTIKRFRPRARGSASPIHKRTSHIRIILTDEIQIERREKSSGRKSTKKKNQNAKPAPASTPAAAAESAPTEAGEQKPE
jgi:large subunit ribosomal protein L22